SLQSAQDATDSFPELQVGAFLDGQCQRPAVPPLLAQDGTQLAAHKQRLLELLAWTRSVKRFEYCVAPVKEPGIVLVEILLQPLVQDVLSVTPPAPDAESNADEADQRMSVFFDKCADRADETRCVFAQFSYQGKDRACRELILRKPLQHMTKKIA